MTNLKAFLRHSDQDPLTAEFSMVKSKPACNIKYFLIERTYVTHVLISFFQIIVLMLIVPLGRMAAKHVK